MPHGWSNQAMMLRFDFESEPFRAALEIFESIEVAEMIYEFAGALSQTKQPRAYANKASGWNKQRG